MRASSLRHSALLQDFRYSRPQSFSICSQCEARCLSSSTSRSIEIKNTRHPRRHQSTWGAAVSAAQTAFSSALPGRTPASNDPLRVVGKELKFLNKNIRQLLGSGHRLLDTVGKYYTQSEGKHVRPMLVLLMAQATSTGPKRTRPHAPTLSDSHVDAPITSSNFLVDLNPDQASSNPLTNPTNESDYTLELNPDSKILPSQRRLAEITELIHLASLLHDDVIDVALTRRSQPSANVLFGNKMAVLGGDFLLGRASVALARLRDPEVTELLATVIANLVEGEFMQLKNTAQDEKKPVWGEEALTYYLQKTYLKSASLISKSCRAAALLGSCSPEVADAAYAYGKNLGLAFQLVDDMLDYTISGTELGKPAGADLQLGLATAPLLFAWKDSPELGELVGRRFSEEGDVAKVCQCKTHVHRCRLTAFQAREIVSQSSGLEQTRALAQEYADKAKAAIADLPESEAKDGLYDMCEKTMKRRK